MRNGQRSGRRYANIKGTPGSKCEIDGATRTEWRKIIGWSVCLSVWLSVSMSVYLSVCLSVYLFVILSVRVFFHTLCLSFIEKTSWTCFYYHHNICLYTLHSIITIYRIMFKLTFVHMIVHTNDLRTKSLTICYAIKYDVIKYLSDKYIFVYGNYLTILLHTIKNFQRMSWLPFKKSRKNHLR
jgi:hypothetical protein